jgi:hypothetical protein
MADLFDPRIGLTSEESAGSAKPKPVSAKQVDKKIAEIIRKDKNMSKDEKKSLLMQLGKKATDVTQAFVDIGAGRTKPRDSKPFKYVATKGEPQTTPYVAKFPANIPDIDRQDVEEPWQRAAARGIVGDNLTGKLIKAGSPELAAQNEALLGLREGEKPNAGGQLLGSALDPAILAATTIGGVAGYRGAESLKALAPGTARNVMLTPLTENAGAGLAYGLADQGADGHLDLPHLGNTVQDFLALGVPVHGAVVGAAKGLSKIKPREPAMNVAPTIDPSLAAMVEPARETSRLTAQRETAKLDTPRATGKLDDTRLERIVKQMQDDMGDSFDAFNVAEVIKRDHGINTDSLQVSRIANQHKAQKMGYIVDRADTGQLTPPPGPYKEPKAKDTGWLVNAPDGGPTPGGSEYYLQGIAENDWRIYHHNRQTGERREILRGLDRGQADDFAEKLRRGELTEDQMQAQISEPRYEGWKNRETWNMALWLGNDYDIYKLLRHHGSWDSLKAELKRRGYRETPDGVSLDDPNLDITELNSHLSANKLERAPQTPQSPPKTARDLAPGGSYADDLVKVRNKARAILSGEEVFIPWKIEDDINNFIQNAKYRTVAPGGRVFDAVAYDPRYHSPSAQKLADQLEDVLTALRRAKDDAEYDQLVKLTDDLIDQHHMRPTHVVENALDDALRRVQETRAVNRSDNWVGWTPRDRVEWAATTYQRHKEHIADVEAYLKGLSEEARANGDRDALIEALRARKQWRDGLHKVMTEDHLIGADKPNWHQEALNAVTELNARYNEIMGVHRQITGADTPTLEQLWRSYFPGIKNSLELSNDLPFIVRTLDGLRKRFPQAKPFYKDFAKQYWAEKRGEGGFQSRKALQAGQQSLPGMESINPPDPASLLKAGEAHDWAYTLHSEGQHDLARQYSARAKELAELNLVDDSLEKVKTLYSQVDIHVDNLANVGNPEELLAKYTQIANDFEDLIESTKSELQRKADEARATGDTAKADHYEYEKLRFEDGVEAIRTKGELQAMAVPAKNLIPTINKVRESIRNKINEAVVKGTKQGDDAFIDYAGFLGAFNSRLDEIAGSEVNRLIPIPIKEVPRIGKTNTPEGLANFKLNDHEMALNQHFMTGYRERIYSELPIEDKAVLAEIGKERSRVSRVLRKRA